MFLDIFHALTTLIVHGDYLGTLSTYGIHEDSAIMDIILAATGR